jgi:hypothetical protein
MITGINGEIIVGDYAEGVGSRILRVDGQGYAYLMKALSNMPIAGLTMNYRGDFFVSATDVVLSQYVIGQIIIGQTVIY